MVTEPEKEQSVSNRPHQRSCPNSQAVELVRMAIWRVKTVKVLWAGLLYLIIYQPLLYHQGWRGGLGGGWGGGEGGGGGGGGGCCNGISGWGPNAPQFTTQYLAPGLKINFGHWVVINKKFGVGF